MKSFDQKVDAAGFVPYSARVAQKRPQNRQPRFCIFLVAPIGGSHRRRLFENRALGMITFKAYGVPQMADVFMNSFIPLSGILSNPS